MVPPGEHLDPSANALHDVTRTFGDTEASTDLPDAAETAVPSPLAMLRRILGIERPPA